MGAKETTDRLMVESETTTTKCEEKKRNVEYQEMKKFNQFESLHLSITSTQ